MFEVKRHRDAPRFGGVPRVIISSSLPQEYCNTLDRVKDRIEGILKYRISRATIMRFAVYSLQELEKGRSNEELIDAYEAAICSTRRKVVDGSAGVPQEVAINSGEGSS